jgi:hypothetical protein
MALGLGAASLALVLVVPRWLPRVPGSIVALVVGTAAVAMFDVPVETIGSRFGGIPSGLPSIDVPAFRGDLIIPLLPLIAGHDNPGRQSSACLDIPQSDGSLLGTAHEPTVGKKRHGRGRVVMTFELTMKRARIGIKDCQVLAVTDADNEATVGRKSNVSRNDCKTVTGRL